MSTIKNFYKDATTEKFMFVDEQGGINVVVAGSARLKTDAGKTKLWLYEGREQLGTATITEVAKTAPGVSAVYYSGWDDFVLTNKDFFRKASSISFADDATVITGTDEAKAVNSKGVLAGFLSWVGSKTFAALPTSAKTLLDSITELWTNKVDDLGGTIYHSTPWFVPVAGQSVTISADGLTVTLSSGALFTSTMVGARIVVNGIRRVVGSYTSTSVMGVSSAFPASMRGVTYTYNQWSINNRFLWKNGNTYYVSSYDNSGGSTSLSTSTVECAGNAMFSYSEFINGNLILTNSSFINFGNGNYYSARDIGFKRNSAGVIEINDGNTVGVYRDLNLRNLNYTGSLTNTSDIRLKQNIRPVTDGLKKVIDISKTIRHYEFIDQDAYGSGVITSEIAQYLLELGFNGHVKQRAPRNEDEGSKFGWEYAQREIVDNDGNPVLDQEGNKTFEPVVTKEGDLIYTVDSQALTIYLFPAIVELNDKITVIEERLNKAGL